ncbi:vacuolar segregation subunit 7-domain-containing protein [Aspergillus pseudoustus]|uniref:Vacuolar segregation subunit 7-domain-containing protein n=1 Tax=Aspergillus pseudoustus TaxID=1810923 RepID=A0ABR4J6D7_9EURO
MAAESERSPYPNGTGGAGSGGPKAAQDDVPSSLTRRSASESDMSEVPRSTTKIQGHLTFLSQLPKPSHPVPGASGPPSTTNSTISSREPSPTRFSQNLRSSTSTSTSRVSSRSRKRKIDRSPPRSATTSPSPGREKLPPATTVQQAPSQPNKPLVLSPPPNVEPSSDAPSPDKSNMPLWAGSRRSEQEPNQPNTSSKRTQTSNDEYVTKSDRSAPRSVNRGVNGSSSALETVQEMASDQSTPSTDTILLQSTPDDDRLESIDEDSTPKASRLHTESGSDSGGNKSSEQMEENRRRPSFATGRPNALLSKRSSTSLSGSSRAKPADGSVRNMIVETETVTSIPQVSVGVGAGERGTSGRVDSGTLRMKPSTETIRPKKEKRRARKPAPLTSGAASSKADIFEAKVASAVDEADVSDSDETFVYESNPPEQYPRQSRYHSRTPSATSMASQVDAIGGRSRAAMREGNHSVTGKRSMKFTNNTYTSSVDGDADEIPRSHPRMDANGSHTPRHHLGRHGRQNMYPSLFDNDSPFPQSQGHKSPRHFPGSGFRQARQPGSRNNQNYRTINSYKKASELYGYDFDAEGADDERTPLVGSPRQTRSRGNRRPNSASLRQMEYMQQRHRSCVSRYGACVLISLLFFLLVGGGVSFLVAITKPLLDVQVLEIQNVLASEQELMLDLHVQAVNPNLFPVVIDDIDVNIFAKSRYVGTDKFWHDHGSDIDRFPRAERRKRADMARTAHCIDDSDCKSDGPSDQLIHSQGGHGGVDKGTDPIPTDPAGDPQTMLIGRVFRLDSTLTFEASPWNHVPSTSKGQIRLPYPGNGTEKGGTERWERVLQHPFELVIGGVVQYQLPLSSRFQTASISSSIKVTPDDGVGNDDPNHTPDKNETVGVSTANLSRRSLSSASLPDGETLKAVRALIAMTRRAFVA